MRSLLRVRCGFWLGLALLGLVTPARAEGSHSNRPAATSQSTSADERISPLADAAEGDWVFYRTLNGSQRLQVVHLTRLLADVEVRTALGDMMIGQPATRSLRQQSDYALDFAESDGAAIETRREKVEAAGRTWNCRLTVARWKTGATPCERRIWMHPDIPIYGVARMELHVNGRLAARMELSDFGHTAPATRPSE